jgi:hypothetical protein
MPAHAVKPTLEVKLRPHVIDRIESTLFPPWLLNHTPHNTRQTPVPAPATQSQHQASSKSNLFRRMTTDDLLTTLRKTKRGTAPGPFCDPIDPQGALQLSNLMPRAQTQTHNPPTQHFTYALTTSPHSFKLHSMAKFQRHHAIPLSSSPSTTTPPA